MTILAMCFPSPLSGKSVTHKDIFSIRDEPQMSRVAARPISANVIDNGYVFSFAAGNRADKQGIHQPMCDVENLVNPDLSISIGLATASPVPATSFRVNIDFIIQFFDLCFSERGNREIISFSHSVSPYKASSRLEPGRRDGRSGSFYYSTFWPVPGWTEADLQALKDGEHEHIFA